ncbi:methyltransferase domain-containing protein [Mastigocoleus testarum]|uniref:Methyltransferase type 11 n=1 Tax=Mastigocoleus testarum BC008 TaxID=371196 RepID=A0A0V7ZN86_9CYAN|nr:hypothetical protein [Mastigocoleus testarum]KST66013.1 methyltransferase type 11 [Mastigocoleus testarum BC008]
MLKNEAIWLAAKISSLEEANIFPILNVGSSTKEFREKTQPWIDKHLFKPAREKSFNVIHTDLKQDEGVDIAGDLCNTEFLKEIAKLNIKSILCSNLLEHLDNREEFCEIISSILPKGGYLFVTVPHQYPYHPDPIDTMFRPTIDELEKSFSTLTKLYGEIVYSKYNGTRFPFLIFAVAFTVRLMLPIYKPQTWWRSLARFTWLFKRVSSTCLVLQKR